MHFTLHATQQFKDDLHSFVGNRAVQDKLSKTFHYLEGDPRQHQGSLRTVPLKRFQNSNEDILKSRVDQSYRLMWCWGGPAAITLLRVGAHDFINNYATFNEDGIASAMLLRPGRKEPVPHVPEYIDGREYIPPAERIFEPWESLHLRLLGVPEGKVRDVKLITDIDQVYDLGLPTYAEKNLVDVYLLADDWSADDLFDSSFIFYRTNARQLEGYCRGRIKQLLLNLSPEQDRLVHLQTMGPTLIKGVAGSGKTTVGIYRAMAQSYIRTLFEQDRDPRVLFLTYTETLARVVEQMFAELYGPDEAKRVEVCVLRDWLLAYLEGKPGARPLGTRSELDNAVGQAIFEAHKQHLDSTMSRERDRGGKARGSGFFASEIADVIKGRNFQAWEQYAKASRTGRKTGLGEGPRRFIWTVYEEYERQLEKCGKFDYLDLALHGIRRLQQDSSFKPYDAVIVDEAQDLRPVQLQVVSLLAGGADARSLILLADPAQSIYYKGIPWKEGNIHIAGARSLSLSRNYRNTRQILEAAWSLATKGASDDPDEEAITPDVTNRRGPRPQVVFCQDGDYHDRFIVKAVEQLCGQMRFRLGDIAVLARRTKKVHHLRALLCKAGMPVVHFREEGFDIFENKVKAVTINSAKGLEFPVVFLADLDEGDLPRYLRVDDDDELQSELRSERRLLYVGMTRAANRLYLVCRQGQASRFLEEIDPDDPL